MTKLATSIEQSRKLIGLGLETDSADMTYLLFSDGKHNLKVEIGERPEGESFLPAWSLSALLDAAMKLIGRQDLELRCNWNGKTWFAIEMAEQSAGCYDAENPIDAVFDLVVEHLKD